VPESGRTTSPDGLVANVTSPVKLPLPVGANVTLSDAVPPACKVSGNERLLVEYPAPLKVAWLTVRSVPPELDRVTLFVLLDRALILPKATDDGDSDSCPGPVDVGVVAVPEAVSDTTILEFDPKREIVRDRFPVAEG
jgi:hypothetical protein